MTSIGLAHNARNCAVVVLAALCTSCSSWHAAPQRLSSPVGNLEPLELWSGGHRYLVYAVQVRGDAVHAIPTSQPPDCNACAVTLSLARIDSVRVRAADPGRTAGLTVLVLVGLLLYAASHLRSIIGD